MWVGHRTGGGGGAQIWSRGNFAESCNTPARVEEGGREREIQTWRPNFASRNLDFYYCCKVFTRLVVKVKETSKKSLFKVTGMKGDSAKRMEGTCMADEGEAGIVTQMSAALHEMREEAE